MRPIAILAVLLGGSWCAAADPDFGAFDKRLTDLETRVTALEASPVKADAKPAKGVCPCPDGGRCTCGDVCPCEAKRAAAPKLVQWSWQGQTCWLPEGYSIPGGSKVGDAPTTSAAGYDCSSGVCRPASAPASYGTPYGGVTPFGGFGVGASSGGCSGGNCSPAAGGFRRR